MSEPEAGHAGSDGPEGLVVVARFDLARLARDLAEAGRHPRLVKAVERAAAAGSIREDLRTALESLQQLQRMQDRIFPGEAVTRGREETVTAGALFVQAIILYARATQTSGSRPKLLGVDKLSPDEHATHDDAMVLPDKCVAHFGRGDGFQQGPLFTEAVLFTLMVVDERPKKQVSVLSTRAQHKAAFSSRLAALVSTRLDQVAARTQKLFDLVDDELEAAGRIDPDLRAELGGYEFDVDAFAGFPEAAVLLRAQLAAGDASDMDYAVAVPRS